MNDVNDVSVVNAVKVVSGNHFLMSAFGRTVSFAVAALAIVTPAAPVAAQSTASVQPPAPARTAATTDATTDQRVESRFQISQLERMLEGAVEHGAMLFRQRLQAALPSQVLITENARVRGFRLDGYGFFFDVEVPDVAGTLAWSLRTLDQNDLGLDRALKEIKAAIQSKGDTNLEQALRRIELQVAPAIAVGATIPPPPGARDATGSPATVGDRVAAGDPFLTDPLENFRAEVVSQIKETMLQYSILLALPDDEWLTIAARRVYDRPLIAPADSDARTVIIRIRGGDLAAFRANRLSKEEALKKMDVREF